MPVEKWFVWSRRLWSVAIPVLVAIVTLTGGVEDVGAFKAALERFGDSFGTWAEAGALLIGAGFGLWTSVRPDGAKLRAKPKPGGLIGRLLSLLLVAFVAGGCAWQVGSFRYAIGEGAKAERVVMPDGQVIDTVSGAALSEGAISVGLEFVTNTVGRLVDLVAAIFGR